MICVDLTKLYLHVQQQRYIIQAADSVLGRLKDALLFSKLGSRSRFDQVKFCSDYVQQTLLSVLLSSPSALEFFHCLMSEILEGLQGALNMIGDILVFGKDSQKQHKRFEVTMKRLVEAGVTLNWKNREFT